MRNPNIEGLEDDMDRLVGTGEGAAADHPDNALRLGKQHVDLHSVLEWAGDGITVQDGNFRIIYQNKMMRELYGDHLGELCYSAYQQRQVVCDNCPITACLHDGLSRVHERRVTAGHRNAVVEVIASPVPDEEGRFTACVEIVRDVTERKKTEVRLRRLSSMYEALSRTNKAIMYIGDKESLLQEVCRVAVEFGPFSLAVIAILDEQTGLLRPEAYSGRAQHYLESLVVSVNPAVEEGCGPTGIAFRENRPYICNDFMNDPATVCWRQGAVASDIRASAAFPLSENDRVRGALKVYADEAEFFDPELVALLEELAANISYSLDNFRLHEEKEREETEWRENQERLQMAMEASNLGMWEWEIREGHFSFSPQFAKLLGYDPEEVAMDATKLYDLIHPEDGARAKRSLQEILNRRSEEFNLQMRVQKKSKEWEWILCQGKVVAREAGKAVRVTGIASCITDQKRYEEKLEYENTHDAMTGLYNRAYFDSKLAGMAATGAVPISIVVADLDGLKEVNDTWGHAEGDLMICKAAKLLQQGFRSEDIVARVGGDEFAIILPETKENVLKEILKRVEQSVAKERGTPRLSLSFGAATASTVDRFSDCVVLADAQMYNNKLKKKQEPLSAEPS